MEYKSIQVERHPGVVVLRLNRPEANNKLNIEMMSELVSGIRVAEADDGVSVIVLSARGEVFCGGGDLGDFRIKGVMELREFGDSFIALHMAIVKAKKPVIAAVNGPVLGGGFSLVDACDLAVASEDSVFAVPEVRAGLAPMMALTGVGRSVSRKKAYELAYTGAALKATEAERLGLINRIVDKGHAEQEAVKWAQEIAGRNFLAISLCKRLYRGMFETDYESKLEKGLDILISLLKAEAEKQA